MTGDVSFCRGFSESIRRLGDCYYHSSFTATSSEIATATTGTTGGLSSYDSVTGGNSAWKAARACVRNRTRAALLYEKSAYLGWALAGEQEQEP